MKRVQTIVTSLAALSPVRGGSARERSDRVADRPETSRYAHAGTEPSLDEMLEDPVVRQRARADGLDMADIRKVLVAAQNTLSRGGGSIGPSALRALDLGPMPARSRPRPRDHLVAHPAMGYARGFSRRRSL